MYLSWLAKNYIEVLGSLAGLVYLYFSIRQIIWLWPLGIITSLLYIFVFLNSKFYAAMGLQVYYFFISIYGWYYWKKTDNPDAGENTRVVSLSFSQWIILPAITGLLTLLLGFILDEYTDSPLPFWDAFTTAGSIVATWMLARRYLENWLFWIGVDLIAIGIYTYKNLYPTVILFVVYTSMAFIGYIRWKNELKKD